MFEQSLPPPAVTFYARFPLGANLPWKAGIDDTLTPSQGQLTVVGTLATPAKALLETPQIARTIHRGVNAFMEVAPSLMRALDEVAKVHPFIGGASPSF